MKHNRLIATVSVFFLAAAAVMALPDGFGHKCVEHDQKAVGHPCDGSVLFADAFCFAIIVGAQVPSFQCKDGTTENGLDKCTEEHSVKRIQEADNEDVVDCVNLGIPSSHCLAAEHQCVSGGKKRCLGDAREGLENTRSSFSEIRCTQPSGVVIDSCWNN